MGFARAFFVATDMLGDGVMPILFPAIFFEFPERETRRKEVAVKAIFAI